MKLYLDLLFFLNFSFDFILLYCVRKTLKRSISIKRIMLGSILGGFSIFFLFLPLNSITLFLLKGLLAILMILISFGYHNLRYTLKNLSYLYIYSILLGGIMYFLNCEFSYKQEGIIFFHDGLSINVLLLILIAPFILYTYSKEIRRGKQKYSQYYELTITFKNGKRYHTTAFLDTGNTLRDPYLKRPIIIINEVDLPLDSTCILVPFRTILKHSYLKCYEIEKVEIKDVKELKDVLVGITPYKIEMEGVDCIIGTNILEG